MTRSAPYYWTGRNSLVKCKVFHCLLDGEHTNLADKSVFAYENGFTKILDGPGLGIEVNEELVQEVARKGHKWKNPIWRNYDGTVAEW